MDPDLISCGIADVDKIEGECPRDGAEAYCQSPGDVTFSRQFFYIADEYGAFQAACTASGGTWHEL
jgi:hypothetical protein